MDPLSQGVPGASASQSFASEPGKQRLVLLVGLLAGMAPDLDVFIRSADDPLTIMDVRYSLLPNELAPLWVIQLKPEVPWQYLDYLNTRDLTSRSRQRFLEMLF